jgi:hypothetical protein
LTKSDHSAGSAYYLRACYRRIRVLAEVNCDFLRRFYWPDACVMGFMHGTPKCIVYILRSDVDTSRHYVGITSDLLARLQWHNDGPGGYTSSHRHGR